MIAAGIVMFLNCRWSSVTEVNKVENEKENGEYVSNKSCSIRIENWKEKRKETAQTAVWAGAGGTEYCLLMHYAG